MSLYNAENELLSPPRLSPRGRETRWKRDVPLVGALPSGLVLTERAVAALRAYLEDNGLPDYRVFYCADLDLHDLESHLPALGEAGAAWEVAPAHLPGGVPLATLTHGERAARLWEAGFLRLARHEVVIGRWYWIDAEGIYLRQVWLCAAPTPGRYHRLRKAVRARRRKAGEAVWQVVRGYPGTDGPRTRRDPSAAEGMILDPEVRRRIDAEVVGFFAPQVAQLYRELGLPYRRGVLMYGPPGNGKTSLVRLIGARLPHVNVMLLRPTDAFDSDDLEEVIRRWRAAAPAILVIEDLDWLLKRLNVSTFLNLLDGVDSHAVEVVEDAAGDGDADPAPPGGDGADVDDFDPAPPAGASRDDGGGGAGLLLVATTNHPEQLDPAVNNRPGRFDVVIEVPLPGDDLRRQFLRRKLPAAGEPTIETLVRKSAGLAFAHLEELLRLSGLLALQAGRSSRSDADLERAVEMVSATHEDATRGFPVKPEVPFGLTPHARR